MDIETSDNPAEAERRMAELQQKGRLQVQGLFLGWLREATQAREQSGIEEEWRLAEDLYAGRYPEQGTEVIPVKKAPVKPGKSQIVVNITKPKTNIAASQIIRRVQIGRAHV